MNPLDKLLEEAGLSYEDLNVMERETYNAKSFDIRSITTNDIKENILLMKNSIAMQLCDVNPSLWDILTKSNVWVKDQSLKARLKNYILLESFLLAPEKAEKALKNTINLRKK